ncbi:unnamed protein product [Candidula unifasciata]|uniref:Uncharacterized protein n=1 Tax=Candidula unifasciata TaxID=100452 RepID=A0A8S3ZC30_9EUPU|nr:unnamed protein product [Candidula unifasciata]
MQSKKFSQTTTIRKTSGPVSVNTRRVPEQVMTSGMPTISSANLLAPPTSSSSTSAAPAAVTGVVTPAASEFIYTPPLMMTPVSQVSFGCVVRPEFPTGDRSVIFDPEQYNPDGSLKTMHKLPGFDQSYAQAMKARYVRHQQLTDKEKELSVNEIFGRSDKK